jgi:O-methyltransferase involved in polyketide biosynthesis
MTESAARQLIRLDTTVAHSARLWNYLLGGKDHFAADRQAATKLLAVMPEVTVSVRATRDFLGRVVRYLAAEAGVRQFLDIGTGLPNVNNAHEVAQAVAPESRVVYVDNDPMVISHARALLTSTPEGATAHVDEDLRRPESIVEAASQVLDFNQPVAILLLGVLDFIVDDALAHTVVEQLVASVPSGSYLVISHPTREVNAEGLDRAIYLWNSRGCAPICARTPAAIAAFFSGLDLLEPGVVTCTRWRPEHDDTMVVADFCGVGVKR